MERKKATRKIMQSSSLLDTHELSGSAPEIDNRMMTRGGGNSGSNNNAVSGRGGRGGGGGGIISSPTSSSSNARGGFAYEAPPSRGFDNAYVSDGAGEPYSAGRGEGDNIFQYYSRHPLPRVGAPTGGGGRHWGKNVAASSPLLSGGGGGSSGGGGGGGSNINGSNGGSSWSSGKGGRIPSINSSEPSSTTMTAHQIPMSCVRCHGSGCVYASPTTDPFCVDCNHTALQL